jgi:hypothetical protein
MRSAAKCDHISQKNRPHLHQDNILKISTMSGIIYAAISGKQVVNAFNGPANSEVAELSAKLLNQIDLSVDTKKSYSSKG